MRAFAHRLLQALLSPVGDWLCLDASEAILETPPYVLAQWTDPAEDEPELRLRVLQVGSPFWMVRDAQRT